LVHKISICAQIYKRKWEKREKEKKKKIFWFEQAGGFRPSRARGHAAARAVDLAWPTSWRGDIVVGACPHVSEGRRRFARGEEPVAGDLGGGSPLVVWFWVVGDVA
jgi:hypothetical protein